ncbi:Ail/Lom family outer membrane beta-barrel protein [Acerihabitans sp. TG2]|uniref:Ail/Lom family outer membrane beta-barrel protein n=1 Tax=Acerihabitans sp. TG2 TaxID=3096008 RepID=UPI002B23379C|nr:Ail/Lom family outer membrane beta-barrel protein [Acerihabitans sp. TG2]MEA9391465.1 Ail/Lom family outer membrane beta-barrel protein [Acerihabitans sp. TG2]
MKKLLLSLATCVTLAISTNTLANDHTVTVGYAQSTLPVMNLGNVALHGVNLKYRYEGDSSVSLITSLAYMGNDVSYNGVNDFGQKVDAEDKFRNYSLAAGPAYRFNEFVSIYGLAGVNVFDVKTTQKPNKGNDNSDNKSAHFRTTSFMYGAGIQINPIKNLALDIGYEGTQKNLGNNSTLKMNGFNVGVGYRF